MNINTLDLNLLKVFAAIYRTRNVSKAADSIGLAQSSMSNALGRLRNQFNDPLFHRSANGVTPTTRADQLAPQIKQVLSSVANMITPTEFDPLTIEDDVTIAAADSTITSLAPLLVPALRQKAPKLRLSFVPLDKRTIFEQLDQQRFHIAIGTFNDVPARFYRKHFAKEDFVCITNKENNLIEHPISTSQYVASDHVLMTLKNDSVGAIDIQLKKQGLSRNIVMTCAQFLPLVNVVANSDLIATIPSSLSNMAERAGCKVQALPFSTPSWSSEIIISQKWYASELGRFLMQVIEAIDVESV